MGSRSRGPISLLCGVSTGMNTSISLPWEQLPEGIGPGGLGGGGTFPEPLCFPKLSSM
jgi:hypothetical protein